MADAENKVEQANTRWWESYLVRYFLGFIVGSLCVVILANELGVVDRLAGLLVKTMQEKPVAAKPDWTAVILVVAFLGMGFCYLASTPITVLHAGRYGRGAIDSLSRYFWFGWVLALLISVVLGVMPIHFQVPMGPAALFVLILVMVILGLYKSRNCADLYPPSQSGQSGLERFSIGAKIDKVEQSTSLFYDGVQSVFFCLLVLVFSGLVCSLWGLYLSHSAFRFFVFGMPVLWIGFVQYAVLFRLLREGPKLNKFYSYLFHARRQLGSRDVRDTYTHLREHSNSVFVVLIELCWLSLVLGCVRASGSISAESEFGLNDAWLAASFIAMGIWVIPTVFMWSRANALERFFAESSDVFLLGPSPPIDKESLQTGSGPIMG